MIEARNNQTLEPTMITRPLTAAQYRAYRAHCSDPTTELNNLETQLAAAAGAFYNNGSRFESEDARKEHKRICDALEAERTRLGYTITERGLRRIVSQ